MWMIPIGVGVAVTILAALFGAAEAEAAGATRETATQETVERMTIGGRYKPSDGAVTPRGAFGFLRESGVKHLGVDLRTAKGAPVIAPEDGTVVYAGLADNPPYRGYGPYVVVIKAAATEGRYHLVGHVDEPVVAQGDSVKAGQTVAPGSQVGHAHWEGRRMAYAGSRTPESEAWRFDPLRWFQDGETVYEA